MGTHRVDECICTRSRWQDTEVKVTGHKVGQISVVCGRRACQSAESRGAWRWWWWSCLVVRDLPRSDGGSLSPSLVVVLMVFVAIGHCHWNIWSTLYVCAVVEFTQTHLSNTWSVHNLRNGRPVGSDEAVCTVGNGGLRFHLHYIYKQTRFFCLVTDIQF